MELSYQARSTSFLSAMRVFVLGRFPPPLDGQSMATQRLAELLDARHDVARLNTEPPATGYVAAEVKFRPQRVRHYLGLRGFLRRSLSAAPQAPVLWASISPVPLGHWRDLAATAPAFRPGQPVYAVLHRAIFDRLFASPVTASTARRLARRLDGFVFLNEELSERCAPWLPPEKRIVIPNTIDEALVCTPAEVAAKQSERSTRRSLRLLFLSNMMPEKGYADVVRAVHLLRTRGHDVCADFIGGWVTDEDQRAFARLVEENGLEEVVVHHGSVTDRARIKAFHLQADAFLLPSYHPTEAQPISIIEALNAGTPVVTTRHGGMPYMVREDREALFVPPRDPAAIAGAVERLADDAYRQRLSEGARRRFEEHFGPDAVRRQWEALLERHA